MEQLHFGFVGLGLIGGSVARALRRGLPACRITVFDPDASACRDALADGVANAAAPDVDEHFSGCDLVFLCAPVACNEENARRLQTILRPDALLTDVGSVKGGIHRAIAQLGLEDRFVGGHPMAGSERTGYRNGDARLLEQAYYILTPGEQVSPQAVDRMRRLVEQMGAIPLIMSCAEHDYITAGVSHLPHVVAAALVNLVRASDGPDGRMRQIAAGGFKDITRISSSSPVMWEHICLSNTDNLLELLDGYIAALRQIRGSIAGRDADAIRDFFERARAYRESFVNVSSGPIKSDFCFFVDIPDEPGALATIATLLAFRQISIKNIGITHNREVQMGALRIELYEEADIARSCEILRAKGYTIHLKH